MKGLVFPSAGHGPQWTRQVAGIYETAVVQALQEHAHPKSVFYDIGANHGYFSLLGCVLVGHQGHCYSFEPLPQNVAVLQHVTRINRIVNHTLVQSAVSNSKGMAQLFLTGENDYRPSLVAGGHTDKLEVETITLDDFSKNHRLPDLLKVDVEGAEMLVLEGAERLLSGSHSPAWIIEVHTEQLDLLVNARLTKHNYRIHYLPASTFSERPYPRHLVAQRDYEFNRHGS